jgi:hypothetical protein
MQNFRMPNEVLMKALFALGIRVLSQARHLSFGGSEFVILP